MLEVKDLVKKYGEKTAIKGLNFKINSGEIVGLLGLNGAGKSTTMNCITGYLAPTSGSITVDGADVIREGDKAKKMIGYLPEVFSFYSDMKVNEYLNFVCDLKGVTKNKKDRKEHIENVCRKVGIWELSGRMIRNLSKGYKQRVGFAQALIGSPKVLILDEPTVGLDPSQIIEIRQLIRDSGKESTVIVSSHILQEIQSICTRIIVIHDGIIAADGTPGELTRAARCNGEITVCLKEKTEEIEKIIKGIPGVHSYTHLNSSEEGEEKYLIKSDGGKDIREDVYLAFSKAGMILLGLSLKEASLENTFLHLTGNDGQIIRNSEGEEVMTDDSNI